MVDTFRPLLVSRRGARRSRTPTYQTSWLERGPRMTDGARRRTALLAGLVDYAGLFPPAALSMDDAVAEYARGRRSPEAWMLGRFVVPAARLLEFARAADAHLPDAGAGEPWRLTALLGADVARRLVAASRPSTGRRRGARWWTRSS